MQLSSAPHATLIERDLKHVWHPCMPMKIFEQYPPIDIIRTEGSYLYTQDAKIIDAIGSWWCKPLGHRPKAVIQAIKAQLDCFDHVMAAQTTHTQLVQLTEQLAALSGLPYAHFASDGSSAVEIALKLTLHARKIQGYADKTQFLSLKNAYHGETFGCLSVSDLGRFKAPYESHCFQTAWLDVPYTAGLSDPSSHDASPVWDALYTQLEALKPSLNAIIVEPLVQGAAGMRTYSLDFLNRLMQWAKHNDIYWIADEIMTGLGRTGRWFASDYTQHKPDIMCLSKALTAGTLPLSMTMISQALFDLFYDDKKEVPFLHSHTHSANALAVSAALATLRILEAEAIPQQANVLQTQLRDAFVDLQTQTKALSNLRGIGGLVAADLPVSSDPDRPLRLQQEALKRGAFIRPINNTLYWFPPINLSKTTLEKLTEITYESIKWVYHL